MAHVVHAPVQEIPHFATPEEYIVNFNQQSLLRKFASSVESLWRVIGYTLYKISLVFRKVEAKKLEAQIAPYTQVSEGGFFKNKLVVCLHGLNNSPVHFKTTLDAIDGSQSTNMHIYIPSIIDRGNAQLDAMVEPIFNVIDQWAQKCGDKELVLVGISNGGRIARAIEARLGGHAAIKKLHVISVVGTWKGSSLVNLINTLHLSFFVKKPIREEMATNSPRITQLNQQWTCAVMSQPGRQRRYTFFASPHDWHVPNYSSTLPVIPRGGNVQTRYAIVSGYGHNGMEDGVA